MRFGRGPRAGRAQAADGSALRTVPRGNRPAASGPATSGPATSGPAAALRETAGGVSLAVEVKPRASRTRVLGVKSGRLVVAVAAPPVDGAANEAVRLALADFFDVPRGRIRIVAGEKSRKKVIEIEGLRVGAALQRLTGSQTPE